MSLFLCLLQIQCYQGGGLQPQLEIFHPNEAKQELVGICI